jgi:hypothetical protein
LEKPGNRNKSKRNLPTKFSQQQLEGIERSLASCSDALLLERSLNAENPQIRELAKALLADKDRAKKAISLKDPGQSVIDNFRDFQFFSS